ncbi:hypothetical protein ACXVRB_05485 [Limosilactobacillus ingluviei]
MNKDNFIRVMLREQFGWDIDIKKPDVGTYVIVPRPDSAMATQIAHGLTGQSAEWTALTDRLRLLNRWATIRFSHVAFLVVNPQVPAKYLYFVKNGRDRYVVPRPEKTPADLAACGDEMRRLVQSWPLIGVIPPLSTVAVGMRVLGKHFPNPQRSSILRMNLRFWMMAVLQTPTIN